MLDWRGPFRFRIAPMVAAAAVAMYLVASLTYLDRFPAVSQDEPWIASSGYKLATTGTLGTDLFAGYHGMERHHFVQMPVYAVLEAGIFRAFGLGVLQMRALSVVFGLALLLVVYAVGREVGGERVGVVALVLMVVQRVASTTEVRPIGILLLDAARMNRYDIAVPVFGFAAMWIAIRADGRRRPILYLVSGSLAGLSGLSHVYGAFWLPALMSYIAVREGWSRATMRAAVTLVAGFMLVWLPWIVWVGLSWPDYVAQMQTVASRLDVFKPAFYAANVLSGDGPMSIGWLLRTLRSLPPGRIGAWTLIVGTGIALVMLLRPSGARSAGEVALLTASIVQLVMFVVLLQVKSVDYVIALWPFGALMLAWLGVRLWDSRNLVMRCAVAVVGAAILIEGGEALDSAAHLAGRISPYQWYEEQIAACIPPGSLVLGFQHYWLGLHDFPYRTWLLPLNMANPDFEASPVPFDVALDRINPAIVLLDRHARQLFTATANPAHRYHYLAVGLAAFRARRAFVPRCVVRDSTYGTMEVYEVRAGT
jgi:4-amino-4-deoxy-L-arabinose transferase-like glycosyltransferase